MAAACLVFVLGAIGLEVAAGMAASSPVPAWAARLVPLAWPRPLRVLWWLAVAAAAFGYRSASRELGLRPRPVFTVLIVAPFLVFAAAVAAGAGWATWH